MKKFNFLVEIPQYMQTQIEAENEEKALEQLKYYFENSENVQYVECDENWELETEWNVLF